MNRQELQVISAGSNRRPPSGGSRKSSVFETLKRHWLASSVTGAAIVGSTVAVWDILNSRATIREAQQEALESQEEALKWNEEKLMWEKMNKEFLRDVRQVLTEELEKPLPEEGREVIEKVLQGIQERDKTVPEPQP